MLKFLKKWSNRRNSYNLTDEDRKKSLELRQKRADLRLLKIEVEAAGLRKKLANTENQTPQEMIMSFISKWLQEGGLTSQPAQSSINDFSNKPGYTATQPKPNYEDVPEEEIALKVSQLNPTVKTFLKGKSDEEIKKLAQKHLGLSGQNITKAIEAIRKE